MNSLVRWFLLGCLNCLGWVVLYGALVGLMTYQPPGTELLYRLLTAMIFLLGFPLSLLAIFTPLNQLIPLLGMVNPFLWATVIEVGILGPWQRRRKRNSG